MTWTPVGSLFATTSTSLTVAPTGTNQLALVAVVAESATVFCNGISGGNCTWTQIGTPFKGTTTAYYVSLWQGVSTASGSATATLAFSGTTPTIRAAGRMFSSSIGAWVVDKRGTIDAAATQTFTASTPTGAGELYFGFAYTVAGNLTAGSTSGYVYALDPNGNALCYDLACTSAAQAPVWAGGTDTIFGVDVLIIEGATLSGAAALSGSGSLSGAGVFAGAAGLSGSGTLSGTATATGFGGGAALSGIGALSGALTGTFTQSAALSGSGTLAATWIGLLQQPPAALAGLGTLGLSGVQLGYPAPLAGQGTLSVLQATGGLVFASPGATIPQAYPGSSQVAVAPPGSSNWIYLGTIGVVTALTYSFVCPGGADKMTCTVMVPATYRTQAFNPGWQVRVTRGGHVVWTGRLDEPVPSAAGWTLTAVGDGQRGTDFLALYTSTWPAAQPDEAVNQAIARGLPWVNPGIGSPAGAWFGQQVDSGAQTLTALLNLVTTRGQLTWYANSQPGGLPGTDISVFPLPSVPNRLLIVSDAAPRTLGGDINTIVIRYQATADTSSSGGTAATYGLVTATSAASVAAHGTIETFIDLSDVGVQSSGAAQAVGNNILAIYKRASFTQPITGHYGDLMTLGGVPIDPGTDQAATCCRAILTDYGYGGEVAPGSPIQFVTGAYEWNDYSQVFTLTPMALWDQSVTGMLSATNTVMTPITAAG